MQVEVEDKATKAALIKVTADGVRVQIVASVQVWKWSWLMARGLRVCEMRAHYYAAIVSLYSILPGAGGAGGCRWALW